MPNKDSNSRLIYHHLSEIDRLADERERLDAQTREINVAWHHHVAAVEPYFAKLGGAVINVYNRVMWLDPVHGIRVKKLRPWIALVPDVEPEPIRSAQPPVIIPAPDVKPMSWAEQQAKMPYVPLTDAQIDEGSQYGAFKDEPHMTDEEIGRIEAIARDFELNEDSDLHAVQTLWGNVLIEPNGEAR